MAAPSTSNKLLVYLGDGETSETFAHPCGANANSVTLTNNTGEAEVLDCTDPTEGNATLVRWATTQDTSMNVTGVVAKESFATWRAWADGQTVKNVRVMFDEALASGGGYWTIPAILTTFEMGREGKGTISFTASIVAAGARVWTAAAA